MKNYEIIKDEFGTIISYKEGDRTISFPMVEGNRHYAEYLRYTAWVEAGNTPEEFWGQDGDQ